SAGDGSSRSAFPVRSSERAGASARSAWRSVDGDLRGLQPLASEANFLAIGLAIADDPAEQGRRLLAIVQERERDRRAIVGGDVPSVERHCAIVRLERACEVFRRHLLVALVE